MGFLVILQKCLMYHIMMFLDFEYLQMYLSLHTKVLITKLQ